MDYKEQLTQIATMKDQLRMTDAEIAAQLGVSRRTVQRWVHDSEYAKIVLELREQWKNEARGKIASLADDVVESLASLMRGSKSDLVRWQAAKTLGEWLGLHELEKDRKNEDDREEALELLRNIAAQPRTVVTLPPPKPGGSLPELTGDTPVEAEIVEENDERYTALRYQKIVETVPAEQEIDDGCG